jgi:hypothetical protein
MQSWLLAMAWRSPIVVDESMESEDDLPVRPTESSSNDVFIDAGVGPGKRDILFNCASNNYVTLCDCPRFERTDTAFNRAFRSEGRILRTLGVYGPFLRASAIWISGQRSRSILRRYDRLVAR